MCPYHCNEPVHLGDMLDHIKSLHHVVTFHKYNKTWLNFKVTENDLKIKKENNTWSGDCLSPEAFENKHFVAELVRLKDEFLIWIYLIGTPEEAEDFEYDVVVRKYDGLERNKVKNDLFFKKMDVLSVAESTEKIAKNRKCVALPVKFVKEYIWNNLTEKIHIYFTVKKKTTIVDDDATTTN